MDITKCLTISTAHITQDTAAKLENLQDKDAMGLSAYAKSEFGFWVYCGENMLADFNGGENIPKDLWECMLLAHENDCRWLCLDCDGEEIEALKTYEW